MNLGLLNTISLCLKRIGKFFYILILLSTLGAFFELIGLSLFLPLFDIIDKGELGNSRITQYFYIFFNIINIKPTLLILISLILFFIILKFIFLMFISYLEVAIITKFQKKLQMQIISLLENAKHNFHTNKNTGTIVNLISRETERYSSTVRNIIRATVTISVSVVFFTFLLLSNFFEMFVLAIFMLIIFFFMKPLINSTKKYSISVSDNYSVVQNLLIELINNFSYLKSTQQTKKIQGYINKKIDTFNDKQKIIFLISRFMVLIKEPFGVFFLSCLIIYFVTILNQPITSVLIVGLIVYKLSQNLFDIQNNFQRINSCLGGVLFVEDHINKLKKNQNNDNGIIIADLKNTFYFKNVYLKYEKDFVLSDLNFEIQPFKTLGIVGPSGSGKSSILALLLGLIRPSSGTISLGNNNLNKIDLKSLRSKSGYVTQDCALFKGTIEQNINYLSDLELDRNKLEKITNQIGFDNLIDRLNEDIGEQGKKLSGGQKQRLSIIRELYKDPNLLIFDEATSSLDNLSTNYFKETISKLANNKTIIIITHNILSVQHCDNIILLEKGKIINQGTYKRLNEEDSLFKKLVKLQTTQ